MDENIQTNDVPEQANATNAVATAVQSNRLTDEMMAEQMSRMAKEAILDLLDRYGYVAKPDTPKAELIKAVLSLHQKEISDAEKLVKESTAKVADNSDPIVRMKFMSLESPNASYEFTYAGPKGFKKNEAGEVISAPKWHFYHNRSYSVPYSVVKHLNSLQVPADVQVQTNTEGFIQNLYSGDSNRQPRFSCIIELTPEQEMGIVQKGQHT